MRRRATILDVARSAEVSIKTVSRVMNGEPNVSEALRGRVLKAAETLDYNPRLSARRLAGKRSFLIGLLMDNPSLAYLTSLQRGAIRRCRKDRYHLIVEPVDAHLPDQSAIEGMLVSLGPDGLILTPPVCDNPLVLDAARRAGVRYVSVAPDQAPEDAPHVCIDDIQAAADMTDHLIGLGHRDIAFIQGPVDHGAARRRLDGFLQAMQGAGCEVRRDNVREGAFTFDSGMACGRALLSQAQRPTAIFAANDDMALGVLAAAEEAGLRVPADVSVAGFDDSPASQYAWPQLTTVRQPVEEMAAAAADMLIAAAAGRAPDRLAVQIGHDLVLRDSTAAPGEKTG